MTTKQFPAVGHLTEGQIERHVERMFDKLDREYIEHRSMETAEYEEWAAAIDAWADGEYRMMRRD